MKKVLLTLLSLSLMGCSILKETEEPVKDEPKQKEVIKEEVEPKEEEIPVDDLKELNDSIQAYIKADNIDPEMISYSIQDLETGVIVASKNAATNFLAGSVYKLPLSMLWYDRIAEGSADYYQGIHYSSSCTEEGGNLEVDYEMGDYIPLCTVLGYTLLYSDNVGGHMLFEAYGGWYNYKNDAASYSKYKQNDEFYSLTNYLNAQYMTDVMKRIYDNQDRYSEVIEYLQAASPDNYLNSAIQVDMVQKVGWYDEYVNACGLSLNGHPYSVCVFTRYNNDGLTIQGKINEYCYNYFNKTSEA